MTQALLNAAEEFPKPRSYGTGPGHLAFEGRKGSTYFVIYLLFVSVVFYVRDRTFNIQHKAGMITYCFIRKNPYAISGSICVRHHSTI
jgi:hypothetical protein